MPRVLVIDDDAAVRESMARMLRTGGYTVIAAARATGIRSTAPSAIAPLEAYAYPGNVRQLEHIIQRALVGGTQSRRPSGSGRSAVPDFRTE